MQAKYAGLQVKYQDNRALKLARNDPNIIYYMKDGMINGYTVALQEPIEFDKIHRVAMRFVSLQNRLNSGKERIKNLNSWLKSLL